VLNSNVYACAGCLQQKADGAHFVKPLFNVCKIASVSTVARDGNYFQSSAHEYAFETIPNNAFVRIEDREVGARHQD
jgi:hypothetical protein